MQEKSTRPCGKRVLLECDETMMTIVCLDNINWIWGVIGKREYMFPMEVTLSLYSSYSRCMRALQ